MADARAGSQYEAAPFCEHSFNGEVCGEVYFYKILKMKDCLFVWIGNDPTFDHLAVSTPSRVVSTPSCTTILGEDVENSHSPLAQKLSKRLKKQVLLSFNAASNEDTLQMLEKRIIEEISKYPERF